MKQQVGTFSSKVLSLFPSLPIVVDTPIYLSNTNITHMQQAHPEAYQKYGADIETILAYPDYIGINKKDSSVEFVREYQIDHEFVKVAVRVSTNGVYYARSLYILNNNRVQNFIKKGTLVKLTTPEKQI